MALVVGRSLVEGRCKYHLLLRIVPYESLEGVTELSGDPIDIGAIVSSLAIGGGFDFDPDSALISVDEDVSLSYSPSPPQHVKLGFPTFQWHMLGSLATAFFTTMAAASSALPRSRVCTWFCPAARVVGLPPTIGRNRDLLTVRCLRITPCPPC